MTSIIKYVKPKSDYKNGLLRGHHHFWLDYSEFEDHREVGDWIDSNCSPDRYQYWPETVLDWPYSRIQFHVVLFDDRDARLFKLRW